MRFRTKLLITSVAIVIIPIILAIGTFFAIGRYLVYEQKLDDITNGFDYSMVSDPSEAFSDMTDEVTHDIALALIVNPFILEDKSFLESVDSKIASKYSFLLVKRDEDIYYVANMDRAKDVVDELPGYGTDVKGIYYTASKHLVKQIDFRFSTGDQGSLYIISGIRTALTASLLIYMGIAIILILLLTSVLLTMWIGNSFFKPIDELNVAMQHIQDGNFDYILPTDIKEKGEIGAMYRNYEDMRLRLKESAEQNSTLGIAEQRKAIVDGLAQQITEIKKLGVALDEEQIMAILLTNQYLDTLNQFAAGGNSTIFLPSGAEGAESLRTQILSAIKAGK